MPDDCGELMDKYFESWNKKTFSERAYAFSVCLPSLTDEFIIPYKPYKRKCSWCRTYQTEDTCTSCGAPKN